MYPKGWRRLPFSAAVEINPRRTVARGTLAPFVDMAALPAETRKVRPCRVKPVGSGAPRFANGDTLFARITPCTENGKTGLVDFLPGEEVAAGSTEFIVLGPRPEITLPRICVLPGEESSISVIRHLADERHVGAAASTDERIRRL